MAYLEVAVVCQGLCFLGVIHQRLITIRQGDGTACFLTLHRVQEISGSLGGHEGKKRAVRVPCTPLSVCNCLACFLRDDRDGDLEGGRETSYSSSIRTTVLKYYNSLWLDRAPATPMNVYIYMSSLAPLHTSGFCRPA